MRIRALALFVALGTAFVATACAPSDSDPTTPRCETDEDCEVGSICVDGQCEGAVCPEIYAPVCGQDGVTYGNDCEARAAHVKVAHPGECPAVCGGIAGTPCPEEGQLCDLPPGMCNSADLQGVCVDLPEICTQDYRPVCGCDGMTYANDCFRQMAGAQKDHDGECTSAG